MMRLPRFRYRAPATLQDAASWLAEDPSNTMLLAGGTDLLPNMKRRHQTPSTLIALRAVPELREIHQSLDGLGTGGRTVIGSVLTLSELVESSQIRRSHPGLWQAVAQVATPHLRNMGTIGGNLCLDTRCTYYNQNYEWRKAINFCMKRDGATCWVATSSPRCLAVSSTDSAPMLQALGATVTLVSAAGRREIPVGELYANDGMRYLTRRPDEILASVSIPNPSGWRSAYWKLRRRGSFDFPVASAAVAAQLDGSRVTSIRIVLGAVASRPLEATRAMELLVNEPLSDEVIEQASAAAGDVAKPMDNTDFELVWRKRMVRTLVANALKEVRGDDVRAERKRLARMELLSVTERQA